MATLADYLKTLADKFREKLGTTDTINAQDFADKIDEVYNKGLSESDSQKYLWQTVQCWDGTKCQRSLYSHAFKEWGATNIAPYYNNIVASDCNRMFFGAYLLESVDMSNWEWDDDGSSGEVDCTEMFAFCSSLSSLDWDANFKFAPANCEGLFCDCSSLKSLTNFNPAQIVNADWMFGNCNALQTISFSDAFPDNDGLSISFENCTDLTDQSIMNIAQACGCDNYSDPYMGTSKRTITFPSTAPDTFNTGYPNYGDGEDSWEILADEMAGNGGWTVIVA